MFVAMITLLHLLVVAVKAKLSPPCFSKFAPLVFMILLYSGNDVIWHLIVYKLVSPTNISLFLFCRSYIVILTREVRFLSHFLMEKKNMEDNGLFFLYHFMHLKTSFIVVSGAVFNSTSWLHCASKWLEKVSSYPCKNKKHSVQNIRTHVRINIWFFCSLVLPFPLVPS